MSLSAWEQQALVTDQGRVWPAQTPTRPGAAEHVRPAGIRRRDRLALREIEVGFVVNLRLVLLPRYACAWVQGAAPVKLWLVTTIALIAVALVYSRGCRHHTCTGTLVSFCASGTSASGSAPHIP